MQREPIIPGRVRVPRGAYGWVDLKVVTGGWLEGLGPDAALTYLFLCAVGNSRGISFWSRPRVAVMLGLSREALDAAFGKLVRRDLIATREHVVQVLSLPQGEPATREVATTNEAECAVSEEEILRHEPAARASLARFHTADEPLPRAVRALATSMARAGRRALTGAAGQGGETRG